MEEQNKLKEEKEKTEEEFHPEEKEWEQIKTKEFLNKTQLFSIGFDTLGQDRNFSEEEVQIASDTIANFREIWN